MKNTKNELKKNYKMFMEAGFNNKPYDEPYFEEVPMNDLSTAVSLAVDFLNGLSYRKRQDAFTALWLVPDYLDADGDLETTGDHVEAFFPFYAPDYITLLNAYDELNQYAGDRGESVEDYVENRAELIDFIKNTIADAAVVACADAPAIVETEDADRLLVVNGALNNYTAFAIEILLDDLNIDSLEILVNEAPATAREMVANKVRELRNENNHSQADLAYELGVTQQQVARWESGINAVPYETLDLISQLYRVPLADFFQNKKAF